MIRSFLKHNPKFTKAMSLVEVLVVLSIMGIIASIIGIPVFDSMFSPQGGKKSAMLFATLSAHAQSWAVESGSITFMQIDLSLGEISFSALDVDGQRQDIEESVFRKRQMPENISILRAELNGEPFQEGIMEIPYFPAGYSERALLILRDESEDEPWTVYFHKFYGETDIFSGEKTLEELEIEDES